MAQLVVRNLDEEAYLRLKQRAKANKRSLEAEVRLILETAASPDRTAFAEWSADIRRRTKPSTENETTRWIREDRDSH